MVWTVVHSPFLPAGSSALVAAALETPPRGRAPLTAGFFFPAVLVEAAVSAALGAGFFSGAACGAGLLDLERGTAGFPALPRLLGAPGTSYPSDVLKLSALGFAVRVFGAASRTLRSQACASS